MIFAGIMTLVDDFDICGLYTVPLENYHPDTCLEDNYPRTITKRTTASWETIPWTTLIRIIPSNWTTNPRQLPSAQLLHGKLPQIPTIMTAAPALDNCHSDNCVIDKSPYTNLDNYLKCN